MASALVSSPLTCHSTSPWLALCVVWHAANRFHDSLSALLVWLRTKIFYYYLFSWKTRRLLISSPLKLKWKWADALFAVLHAAYFHPNNAFSVSPPPRKHTMCAPPHSIAVSYFVRSWRGANRLLPCVMGYLLTSRRQKSAQNSSELCECNLWPSSVLLSAIRLVGHNCRNVSALLIYCDLCENWTWRDTGRRQREKGGQTHSKRILFG